MAEKAKKSIKQNIPAGQQEAMKAAEAASKTVRPAPATNKGPKQIIDLPRGGRRIDN